MPAFLRGSVRSSVFHFQNKHRQIDRSSSVCMTVVFPIRPDVGRSELHRGWVGAVLLWRILQVSMHLEPQGVGRQSLQRTEKDRVGGQSGGWRMVKKDGRSRTA